jgi:hypothetical protein
MAKRGIEILSDDAALKKMGELARWEAQSRFCSTKIISQYEAFYARVLERSL